MYRYPDPREKTLHHLSKAELTVKFRKNVISAQ